MKILKYGLAVFACSITSIFAITTDEIIQLHQAGVQTNTIINMLRIDGPKNPSVDELLKLRKENIPDSILEALTAQGAMEGMKPVKVEGPTLKVEDKISIAQYQALQAQANASTRRISIDDPSYRGLGEAGILFYLVNQNPQNISDDLIFAFVNFDSRYSSDYYRRIKNDEFEFNRSKKGIIERMVKEASSKSVEHVSYKTKLDIGEYDFGKKQFSPDFFNELNRGYVQVAGVRYPVVVVNQDKWFKNLPLAEPDAKQRLNISPNRRVDAIWGFTIKEVSKENGVVVHADSLNLLRDLNSSGDSFWKYNSKYVGKREVIVHPDFPYTGTSNLGDFNNPKNMPVNVRVFVVGDEQDIVVRSFHDRFSEEEAAFYRSLPNEQNKIFLERREVARYYHMPFKNGEARYIPCSSPTWIYLYRPKGAHTGFEFKEGKLNVAIVEVKKGFFRSSIKTKMIYLDKSQRDLFENGTINDF